MFSGTVRRAAGAARPYYDKTQRNHTQSPASDVAHLAKLTAMIKGRILDTGVGFAPTESSTTHNGNRCSPAWENGAQTWVQVCGRAHHSSDAEGVKQHPKWQSYSGSPTYDYM